MQARVWYGNDWYTNIIDMFTVFSLVYTDIYQLFIQVSWYWALDVLWNSSSLFFPLFVSLLPLCFLGTQYFLYGKMNKKKIIFFLFNWQKSVMCTFYPHVWSFISKRYERWFGGFLASLCRLVNKLENGHTPAVIIAKHTSDFNLLSASEQHSHFPIFDLLLTFKWYATTSHYHFISVKYWRSNKIQPQYSHVKCSISMI